MLPRIGPDFSGQLYLIDLVKSNKIDTLKSMQERADAPSGMARNAVA